MKVYRNLILTENQEVDEVSVLMDNVLCCKNDHWYDLYNLYNLESYAFYSLFELNERQFKIIQEEKKKQLRRVNK